MAIRKVNKIHKIDILDQYENSTISQLVSQLREDELYRFFQTFLITRKNLVFYVISENSDTFCKISKMFGTIPKR